MKQLLEYLAFIARLFVCYVDLFIVVHVLKDTIFVVYIPTM